MKKTLSLICLILVSFSIGCLDANEAVRVDIGDVYVDAVIVDSTLERSRGLMFRENLNETEGMLFVYDVESYQKFWMKNMNFPIDIIWIDANMSIVHIEENVPPCEEDDCPTYPPSRPAKYVLEVKANFTKRYDVKIGEMVSFNRSFK
ncbi:MAG: DUF192 domain-containing protein [Halobacteriota archaeon]|nr:DUF192 domain-containing protein [Halobacteriota archaeon]